MDFGWNESGPRMDPRCDVGGTKVKNRWNINGTLMEIKWGCKWKQYFFNMAIVVTR
jgi:hypothetical protein